MSAAIYAARQKMDSFLLTREFGGQMAKKEVEIENYPGLGSIPAAALIGKFREHLEKLNVEVRIGEAAKIEKAKVLLAAGTSLRKTAKLAKISPAMAAKLKGQMAE